MESKERATMATTNGEEASVADLLDRLERQAGELPNLRRLECENEVLRAELEAAGAAIFALTTRLDEANLPSGRAGGFASA